MSDNLVLDHLRHIRGVVEATREEVREVKHRLTAVEIGQAGLKRDLASLAENVVLLSSRLEDRVERIEHRLDIVPA